MQTFAAPRDSVAGRSAPGPPARLPERAAAGPVADRGGGASTLVEIGSATHSDEARAEQMAERAMVPITSTAGASDVAGGDRRDSTPRTPSSRPRISAGGGRPLEPATRTFFESRFGSDFGDVRVHTGDAAARSAQSVGAQAYALGRDIVFDAGEYRPRSADGLRLLAHELAHTIQPARGPLPVLRRRLKVKPGVTLDTQGFAVKKEGDEYVSNVKTQSSVRNEVFSGLFASPRVFGVKGSTSAEANANVATHLRSRLGVVDYASKKRYAFAAGVDFKMNPDYWVLGGKLGFDIRPDVDPLKAVDDLNVNPKKYEIACFAATFITMVGGGQSPVKEESTSDGKDWIPGDWGYITNTKFDQAKGPTGNEGENLIYTGKGMFWGHWPGKMYKPYDVWFDQVKGWDGGAALRPSRRRPVAGLE